jgi:Holliday junction DNA helicase RuvB
MSFYEDDTDGRALDPTLRPSTINEYIGQENVRKRLHVAIRAAKMSGRPLDHVLLSGPPGLGKTTLAAIIAHEMGVGFHQSSGPAIDKKGELAAMLTGAEEGDVVFIDEIHRLTASIEENLYPAMEDFELDIFLGEGPHAQSLKLELQHFTLVGATTRAGLLTQPLLARFGITERLNYYDPDSLCEIVLRSASILDMVVDDEAALAIARRSRGTPRHANRLLRRVRDYMVVQGAELVDIDLADHAMEQLGIDEYGFDDMTRSYLHTLVVKFDGGPVGIETIAAAIGEKSQTLEDVYEPYLIKQGFLNRTPRGRVATVTSYRYCDVEPIHGSQSMPGLHEDEQR